MKIYITASFKGSDNRKYIEEICSVIKESGFEVFCFVRDVKNDQKAFRNAHELMQRSKKEIEGCNVLLIDYDGPGHGRMIELGIAYALNKKIVLIAKKGTVVKETVSGVTDRIIEYEKLEDIIKPLSKLISSWKQSTSA